ncbi:hypothetical protein F5I97DRAFT_1811615 [Phlebopus sp. FC_14]|nr:hypothetical protein F5I97DRAFT_1811615 [Phlebopus sp. FC_14]
MPALDTFTTADNTLGALLVGFGLSMVAFGAFTIQVYTYYRRYPSDKAGYKALVSLVSYFAFSQTILETVDQAFIGHCVYYYTVTNYLNPIPLLMETPIWCVCIYFCMCIPSSIPSFKCRCFALRVWRFSYRNWWLTGILMLLTAGQMGAMIPSPSSSFGLAAFPDLTKLRVVGSISLGLGVANDMAIAGALCFYLQRIRSSYSNADSLVNTLIIYAVNTGALTSACSFSTLVCFNVMPQNFVFIGIYFVLSKLYAISFLATLNTRKTIRGRGTDRETGKTANFQMVTDSMQRSAQIPMQGPIPPIPEDQSVLNRTKVRQRV